PITRIKYRFQASSKTMKNDQESQSSLMNNGQTAVSSSIVNQTYVSTAVSRISNNNSTNKCQDDDDSNAIQLPNHTIQMVIPLSGRYDMFERFLQMLLPLMKQDDHLNCTVVMFPDEIQFNPPL